MRRILFEMSREANKREREREHAQQGEQSRAAQSLRLWMERKREREGEVEGTEKKVKTCRDLGERKEKVSGQRAEKRGREGSSKVAGTGLGLACQCLRALRSCSLRTCIFRVDHCELLQRQRAHFSTMQALTAYEALFSIDVPFAIDGQLAKR